MRAILMSCNNCNKDYAFDEVSKLIKPDMKVVCVPFASELHWQLNGDFTNYKKSHFPVFNSFGITNKNISIVKLSESREDIIVKLQEADIVFLSGGYMENFMFIIKSLRLEFVFDELKETKIFMGESAGTLVMLNEYMEIPFIEDDYRRFRRKKGLGIIYGLEIYVHYQKRNKKHRRNKQILALLDSINPKKIICLTDESLMIHNNGETKLIGDYETL